MKKFLLSAVVIIGFGLYVLFNRKASQVAVAPPVKQSSLASAPSALPSVSVKSGQSQSRPTSNVSRGQNISGMMNAGQIGMMNQGRYKDGTYTGSVADAYYGPMQVAVVIQGGKITDVQFLQYPSDRSTSIAINSQAMPYLKAEAIQAQSAQVDIVSGATQSSQAFVQSLSSALSQAS